MHTLIIGITESGKTTLGKKLAAEYQKQGFPVHVLTTVYEPWPSEYITANKEEFIDVFWKSRRCMIFIDEAGSTAGRYDKVMEETATQGRHWGHSCHFLVQAGRQLNPTIREQCSQLFVFNIGKGMAKDLSEEWNQPLLEQAPSLKKGDYFRCLRFGPEGKPFISKGTAFS